MRTLPKSPVKFESSAKLSSIKIGNQKVNLIIGKDGVVRPVPKLY